MLTLRPMALTRRVIKRSIDQKQYFSILSQSINRSACSITHSLNHSTLSSKQAGDHSAQSVNQSITQSINHFSTKSEKREWMVDNPYTGELYVRIPLHSEEQINQSVNQSIKAFDCIKQLPLSDRQKIVEYFCDYLSINQSKLAEALTNQMGKPINQSIGEIKTAISRARSLIDQSNYALRDRHFPVDYDSYKQSINQSDSKSRSVNQSINQTINQSISQSINQSTNQFEKFITLEPIGVVLCLAPWNYAYLCAINCVASAVLSGDSVLLKMSDRTPLVGQAFEDGFKYAVQKYIQSVNQSIKQSEIRLDDLQYVVQNLNIDHADVNRLIENPSISYVQFTGSVAGGRAINQSVYKRNDAALTEHSTNQSNNQSINQSINPSKYQLIDFGLELGGKDPAYLRSDADLDWMVDSVMEGCLYNSGQSCCAVERIYVHQSIYEKVIDKINQSINQWKVGNPMDPSTTMGPLAQRGHGERVNQSINQSIKQGAKLLHGGFDQSINQSINQSNDPYRNFPATVLIDCTNSMPIFRTESFAPIVALCKVVDDRDAIACMNDSAFGLTASVWTNDRDDFVRIARQIDAGTVFMNRCDTLDPELAWAGRKNSGKGEGLSEFGFAAFVKTKSWNMKLHK